MGDKKLVLGKAFGKARTARPQQPAVEDLGLLAHGLFFHIFRKDGFAAYHGPHGNERNRGPNRPVRGRCAEAPRSCSRPCLARLPICCCRRSASFAGRGSGSTGSFAALASPRSTLSRPHSATGSGCRCLTRLAAPISRQAPSPIRRPMIGPGLPRTIRRRCAT